MAVARVVRGGGNPTPSPRPPGPGRWAAGWPSAIRGPWQEDSRWRSRPRRHQRRPGRRVPQCPHFDSRFDNRRPPGPGRWAAGWPYGSRGPLAREPVAVQSPRGRVVEFSTGQVATAAIAPRHQDLAVGQQGGRMTIAGGGQGAGGGPAPRGRVVEFGAGTELPLPSLRPRPPGPCRWAAGWPYEIGGRWSREPVAVQVPVAGS